MGEYQACMGEYQACICSTWFALLRCVAGGGTAVHLQFCTLSFHSIPCHSVPFRAHFRVTMLLFMGQRGRGSRNGTVLVKKEV